METMEDHIEFCLQSYSGNGYIKWIYKNYKGYNTNILLKVCFELSKSYIANELDLDLKSCRSVMKEYSADLKCKIDGTELLIVIEKI